MSQQDIRGFFSPDPTARKKRKTSASTAVEAAADALVEDAKDKENQQQQSDQAAVKDKDADSSAGSADADADIEAESALEPSARPRTFKDLARNAKALMHATWFSELEKEFKAPYFALLTKFLAKEETAKRTIYPPPEHVFAALRDCAFSSLKVVIIGQDPYHGPNQAHGLCFSVQHGVPPPPSLKNIYKEAMTDVKIKRPTHGCLTSWSKQGVLLLNTVLTVRRSEPNSHKNQGWERFTDALIDHINRNASHLVFMLWGKPAQLKCARIDKSKHLVLASSHPSPLGATKTNAPFIGSKCFSKANAYLVKHDKDPIDWQVE